MPRRLPDRLSWPVAAAVILVLSPLIGVAFARVTVILLELAR